MSFLSEIAKEVASNSSHVIEGREKISCGELMARNPDGVTVTEVDLISGDNGDYAVFTTMEESGFYTNAGKSFTDIVKAWLEKCETIENVNATLQEENGVRAKFEFTKTKAGRDFTKVTIIE